MFIFNSLEWSLRLISPPHIGSTLHKKVFLYYILLTDQVSVCGCIYFLGNICIVIIVIIVDGVIYFDINSSFFINSFIKPVKWPKKIGQKFKIVENEKNC